MRKTLAVCRAPIPLAVGYDREKQVSPIPTKNSERKKKNFVVAKGRSSMGWGVVRHRHMFKSRKWGRVRKE